MNFKIKEMHLHNLLRYYVFYSWRKAPIEMTPSAKMVFFKEYNNDWVKDYIPDLPFSLEGKTVLDVGAGCGETAYFFFKIGVAKVICIEPDEKKLYFLRVNARLHKWNVVIVPRPFSYFDMETLVFDFAKIDCEGGESELLFLNELPSLTVEIHSPELARSFHRKFPEMLIEQRYRIFKTWIGKIKQT